MSPLGGRHAYCRVRRHATCELQSLCFIARSGLSTAPGMVMHCMQSQQTLGCVVQAMGNLGQQKPLEQPEAVSQQICKQLHSDASAFEASCGWCSLVQSLCVQLLHRVLELSFIEPHSSSLCSTTARDKGCACVVAATTLPCLARLRQQAVLLLQPLARCC